MKNYLNIGRRFGNKIEYFRDSLSMHIRQKLGMILWKKMRITIIR